MKKGTKSGHVEKTPACEIRFPAEKKWPFLVTCPHSGREFPPGFQEKSRLDAWALRRSEDAYVDLLMGSAPRFGVPLMKARISRAAVDLNRAPMELDPAMFSDSLPPGTMIDSPRVQAGLGTVPRVVAAGMEIYEDKLSFEQVQAWLKTYYHPYHARLREMITRTREAFGYCLLLDMHSMPSAGEGEEDPIPPAGEADIVLGDLCGRSCAPEFSAAVETLLTEAGYRVRRNQPYAGGHTMVAYGRPEAHVHAIQIEIARRLYMDEETYETTEGFEKLKTHLATFLRYLAARFPAEPRLT